MDDEAKSKAELIEELRQLRRQVASLVHDKHSDEAGPAARRSARLFAQAFKVNPAAISITRLADGHFIDINDSFLDLLGYTADEVIGWTSEELRLWVDPEERRQIVQLLAEHGVARDVDVHFRTKHGDILDGRTAVAFIDIDGEPCALTVVQDVTSQLRAEQAQRLLIEASTILSASLDEQTILDAFVRLAVPQLADWCGVDMFDVDGVIYQSFRSHRDTGVEGQRAEQLTRSTMDVPAVVQNVVATGRAEIVPEVSEDVLQAIVQEPDQIAALKLAGACAAMIVPLKIRERVIGAIIFIRATSGSRYRTEDLRLADELARRAALALDNALLYREAQQALKARDAFLSVAAHELKTPTTLIMAHAELLQRRAERESTTSERDLRALRTLGTQARRLERLIQAVLDVSRLQGGTLALDRRTIDAVALTRQVVEEFTLLAADHTLVFSAPPEAQEVDGDALRLEQVLQNLLQNAIKYSPKGSMIQVKVERRASGIAISVADQGIGVPEAVIPELFRPFYRARNIDPGIVGLGIGLFVVKELVTLHGGSIQVDSSEGRGSTFTVVLPARQEEHRP